MARINKEEQVNIIYARFSKDDSDTFSIDSQVRRITDYMQRNGIRIDQQHIYSDEFTGTDFINRVDFNKVKRLLESGAVANVVVAKVNRISRIDHHALMFLTDYVHKNGAQLHIVEWNGTVSASKTDRMRYGMEAMFGTFEWQDIKDRTANGRLEKVQQGIYLGAGIPPYAYDKRGSKRNTTAVIVPEEAKIVETIFRLFVVQKEKIIDIVRFLNARNIPAPNSRGSIWTKSAWTHNAISRILRDSRYKGVWYAYRYVTNQETGKSQLRDRKDWIKQEFPHLAIIDADIWQEAQDIIDNRRDRYTFTAKYDYLLAKRAKCICGNAAGVQMMQKSANAKQHFYYRCGRKRVKGVEYTCPMPYVSATLTDTLIWDKVEELIRNPEWELEKLREAQKIQQEQHSSAIEESESLESIRAEYERELDELYQDYKDKLITRAIYEKRKEPLDARLKAAEELAAEAEAAISNKVLSNADIKHIVASCNSLAAMLDEIGALEFAEKRKIIELLNVRGEFAIEDDWIVLRITVHNLHLDTVTVRDSLGGHGNSGSHRTLPNGENDGSTQSPYHLTYDECTLPFTIRLCKVKKHGNCKE